MLVILVFITAFGLKRFSEQQAGNNLLLSLQDGHGNAALMFLYLNSRVYPRGILSASAAPLQWYLAENFWIYQDPQQPYWSW